ncbi:MAG: ATP-dependent sacrificial sulfur transferase LarE [Thermoproteota archaeon]|nr:ATP-dependent sacrificial sulfur transferase LarE [Thermoproteota archaeon]
MSDDREFTRIVSWFKRDHDRAMVALSGGVDSAVVALAAKQALGNNVLAVTADYSTLSREELKSADNVAKEIGINHITVKYNELENENFVRNDKLRCYHCRMELGSYLASEATKRSITLIVDGTNLDDLDDYRPGIRAMRSNGIRSPLVELGISKNKVRTMAKFHALSTYDKPSNSCLASRIPTGITVTMERIRRIEMSEMIVKSIFALKQVRVRDHGDLARIEVGMNEIQLLFDPVKLNLLNSKLKSLGFRYVTIDLAGYHSNETSR